MAFKFGSFFDIILISLVYAGHLSLLLYIAGRLVLKAWPRLAGCLLVSILSVVSYPFLFLFSVYLTQIIVNLIHLENNFFIPLFIAIMVIFYAAVSVVLTKLFVKTGKSALCHSGNRC